VLSRKWKEKTSLPDQEIADSRVSSLCRRARQMRLPTAYKPALLAHRSSNPKPPRPRDLLASTPVRPPSPRAAISSLLLPSHQHHRDHHRTHSDNNGDGDATRSAAGRLVFPSARSTDAPPRESYNGARREVSPARSAVSQPPPASTVVAGDSDARASLWAELKDIRRRARTPGAGVVLPAI